MARSKSSSIPATTFHLFPWLPVELRFEIWRLCLPHRVCEKDQAIYDILFDLPDDDTPTPCFLYQTTEVNGRPPVITRVCRESRAVALKTGGYYEFLLCDTTGPLPIFGPPNIRPWWFTGNCINKAWFDRTRDVMHLNWEPLYQVDYFSDGSPLQSLAWDASLVIGGGSLSINFFQYTTFRKPELITVCQCFRRDSAKMFHQILRNIVIGNLCSEDENLSPEDVLCRLRPVIMFRLCTEMCNRIGSAATLKGLHRSMDGRGLGRAQRLAREKS